MEYKIKHLEFIIAAIARMSNHSATLKSFCLVLVAGAMGLAASSGTVAALLYLVPMVLIFAGLDAKYLSLERAFRRKYEQVRVTEDSGIDFSLLPPNEGFAGWLGAFFSWSVFGFYGSVAVVLVAVCFFPNVSSQTLMSPTLRS